MAELKYPWHVVTNGNSSIWSGATLLEAQNALTYYLKHPGTYPNPRIIKVGIVDNDPVVETKTEIVRYSFLYKLSGDNGWTSSGMYTDRYECETSRKNILLRPGGQACDIVETKYVVTTTEKVNK